MGVGTWGLVGLRTPTLPDARSKVQDARSPSHLHSIPSPSPLPLPQTGIVRRPTGLDIAED